MKSAPFQDFFLKCSINLQALPRTHHNLREIGAPNPILAGAQFKED